MRAIWHLHMLGNLRAELVDGSSEPITRFRTQKAAALLAYLSLHPGAQPRETLTTLLWPDVPPEAARNSLSVALSSLRHQLEPPGRPAGSVLTADRATVGLQTGAVTTDVSEFRAVERSARPQGLSLEERRGRLRIAAEAYRGPFLNGFYDDWILLERQTLGDLFSRIIGDLVPLLPPTESSDWLRQAAQRDPDQAAVYIERLPERKPPALPPNSMAASDTPSLESRPVESRAVTLVAVSGTAPEILTGPLRKHHGVAVSGDLFAFSRAAAGLAFAVECLHVSMERCAVAVYTGETPGADATAVEAEGTVRALRDRIPAGRIVCGEATAALARPDLPAELRLWDLGVWPIVPARPAERLFEVRVAGTPSPDSPAITGLTPIRGGSLPAYTTRFFGRDSERARITELLSESRLVTLLGLGGMGKTRLALETLRPLAESGESVVFVPLMEWSDGSRILGAICATLQLPVRGGTEERESLVQALAERPTLLLLDNLEQMGDSAATPIADLLEAVPSLRILVTSRRALNLPGERLLPLAPLTLAQEGGDPVTLLESSPAVALFCDRARIALPDFQLTPRNCTTVAALCRRLDGIPLALELTASRARVLTPGQWLERLERGLDDVATSARAGTPERHRTLLTALRWSYDLLPPETQIFFRKLGAFHGGWSLEAAEAITEDPLALDHLAVLGENSLVWSEPTRGEGLRFLMLEIIREFAATVAGDMLKIERRRHADYFAATAARHTPVLRSGDTQKQSLSWFEEEEDNLRAALATLEEARADKQLTLAADLGRYWEIRGAYAEANQTLERTLAVHPIEAPESRDSRSAIHLILGNIAHNQGRFDRATSHLRDSLRLREEAGDDSGAAMALNNLSLIAAQQSDFATARDLAERSVIAHRRAGNEAGATLSLVNLANLYGYAGEWAEAERRYREAIPALRSQQNESGLSVVYANLCACAAHRGDLEEAERWARDSVAMKEARGDRFGLAQSLDTLMEVLYMRGNRAAAWECLRQSLRLLREIAAWRTVPVSLLHAAQLERDQDPIRSAGYLGAAVRINREDGMAFPPHLQADADTVETLLRTALGEDRYATARAAGERWDREEAVALALSTDPSPSSSG